MIEPFPEMVPTFFYPALHELIHVLNIHLILRAQIHMTTVSSINVLYICIPPVVYIQSTAHPYPVSQADPVSWNGGGVETPLGCVKTKAIWNEMYKYSTDAQNNRAKKILPTLPPNTTQLQFINVFTHSTYRCRTFQQYFRAILSLIHDKGVLKS